ncbi:glycosyl transferase [Marivirga lumbricoides]|uniref:Glycosyl transferase n=1 Tax=Marivirga lumbricoides TaxID=1046115 RepID=A0ABQ1MES2_9BACT|nr:glycosyl transferase [Marivirga lumbricoides]
MKKKLLINALAAQDGGGITYLTNILPLFDKEKNLEIILLLNSGNKDKIEKIHLKNIQKIYIPKTNNIWYRIFWEFFNMETLINSNRVTHYYCPGGIMVPFKIGNVTTIVAFRNMLPFYKEVFKHYNFKERLRLQLLKKLSLLSFKGADKVVFISSHAKQVIEKYIPSIDAKSETIYHGKNDLFNPHKIPKSEEIPDLLIEPYIIYVSTITVYKHQHELIEAYYQLVQIGVKVKRILLVGSVGSEYGDKLLNKIKELKLENQIVYVGKIEYEKLPKYYQNADSVIYASSCENCPNILIESMSMGKIIYSSNCYPMPEFGGDSLIYFNPKSVKEFKDIILQESNRVHNGELNENTIKTASQFDWKNTYHQTLKFIMK